MYILDTRDELMKYKKELKMLSSEYSDMQTEFIMMKKYFQENNPQKYSKQKFDLIKNECLALKNELEVFKQCNTSLREEISGLTKSCIQSNEIIATVLSEIQHGSKSSIMSLHNLVVALEQKISLLLSKSFSKEKREFNGKLNEDTQQFLQKAMNTLKNSSILMKGVIEPCDESNHASINNINQKRLINNYNTYDHEAQNKSHNSCLINEGTKIAKSFEYYLDKKKDSSKSKEKSNSRI